MAFRLANRSRSRSEANILFAGLTRLVRFAELSARTFLHFPVRVVVAPADDCDVLEELGGMSERPMIFFALVHASSSCDRRWFAMLPLGAVGARVHAVRIADAYDRIRQPRMPNDPIAVPYNHKLTRLESLLAGVKRAGDFFVHGSLDAPIPRVDIDGVGVLSFPVPDSQIEAVVRRAQRAPYGRGEHTIVDTSVRNAWQLDAAIVRISGKAWETIFQQIMSRVIAGLGCSGMSVSATLYKLLVYETGGLFRPHRDTEKADGMFGTLVGRTSLGAWRRRLDHPARNTRSQRASFKSRRVGTDICRVLRRLRA